MNNDRFPINLRLLAMLVGGAIVLGIVLFLGHAVQGRRQAGIYLAQARAAKKAAEKLDELDARFEQVTKASANYSLYGQIEPHNYDVVAEQGLMLANEAETFAKAGRNDDAGRLYGMGLGCLEKVLREDPNRVQLRRTLIRSLGAVGFAERAIDHIAFLAKVPANAEGLRSLFDRYDLWRRAAAAGRMEATSRHDDVLARFLLSDGKTVDREQVLSLLKDDLWMVLEDAELLSIFGRCQILLNRSELAEKPLEKAALLAPGNLEDYHLLAELLRRLGRDSDADYWMSELVNANPDSFEALRMRGDYRAALVRRAMKADARLLAREALSDATESISKAIEQAADKADAAEPSSPLNKALKTAFEAARAMKPREDEPATPAYRDRLVEAARRLKTLSEKVPNARKELEGVRNALALAARCELAAAHVAGDTPKDPHLESARIYGTAAVELAPSHAAAYLTLAEVEQESGHEDQAIEWLRRGNQFKEARPAVTWQLAVSLIRAGRVDEARAAMTQMAQEHAPDVYLTHLKGLIHYSEKNWLAAKEDFERVLPQLAAWPESALSVNLMIAECCQHLGLVDQQRAALMRAAALDLTSVDVLSSLAELEMASGQLEEAIEDYRLVLRLKDAPPGAHLALARAVLAKNLSLPKAERDWHAVEAAINDAEKLLPNAPPVVILRAELLAARDKPRDAAILLVDLRKQLLQEIIRLRTQRQAALDEAETLSGEAKAKKLAEAEQLGQEARQHENLQSSVWQSLVGLAERERDWEGASRMIQAAEGESGDSPQIRVLKARNLARRYGAEAAMQIKELLQGIDAFPAPQQTWLRQNFAVLAYDIRDYPTAEELCGRILQTEPDNLEIQRLRFQIAGAQSDVETMEAVLKRIKEIEKNPSAFWHYGEALRLMLLVDKGGSAALLRQALDQLNLAAQLNPKWGQVNLLTAMVHERMGNTNAAIDEYLEAIDLGAYEPNTVRHVAGLLIRSQRLREADRMFRVLTEQQPLLSEEVSREMRFVKSKLGEFDAAIEPARKIAASSKNITDHIWLGQLLSMVSQRMRGQGRKEEADSTLAEAEKAFRDAVILRSDAPEPWVALIQFFAQTQQNDKVEQTIAQARRQLAPAVAAMALAQCYEVLNQPAKAAEQYEAAIANAPRDSQAAQNAATFYLRVNQVAKAQAQLMRIIRGEVNATKEQRMLARRRMAMMLSQQAGAKNREEATAWIEMNLAEEPESLDDQYLKAVILANDLTGRHNQEAIALLEKLFATQRNPGPEMLFTLAQLYRAEGNWREYRLRMDKLLKNYRDVPQYLAAYAAALIEEKDYHEAEVKAAELAKVAPGTPATTMIRAELAFQQRQYERTKRLLHDYLNDPTIAAAEKNKRLPDVANTLEEFAGRLRAAKENSWADMFSKEAYQLYREYVDLKPDQEILIASFLARQERLDEAIDQIEILWETADPEQVALACFAVIDGKGASTEQIARIDRILQKAAARHPDSPVIQIATAVLRGMQDRFGEAEAIYRKILDKAPDNPTALNNLAVLLAQQGVKLNEAAKLIDRAIAQMGPAGVSGDLYDSRAIVQLALNHPLNALEDLQKAIAEKPTAVRYLHQAEAFYASGQRKAAVQALQRALDMGLREDQLQGVERRKFNRLQVLLK